jgi:hypothetical protein
LSCGGQTPSGLPISKLVADGVDDPTDSPAVLLTHRSDLGGTGSHSVIEHGVGVADHESVLLIPGTSSAAQLADNVTAGNLRLDPETLSTLEEIALPSS